MQISSVRQIHPTNKEVFFEENELIVSRTDLKGRITYCNRLFTKLSGFKEKELLGMPHSVIRHPDMPRIIFKLLWDYIANGKEIFAYVKNMCKSGDHYWVFAHVTPTYNNDGQLIGYHSNRRVPNRETLKNIEAIYAELLKIERSFTNRKDGLEAAEAALHEILKSKNVSYDEYMFIS
ncbi:MAG: putative sensor domain for methyl-accepting chemotaxis sensory transducer [Rickettsiaceae bacterium]|jgi:PAS domain S-box-containing protein|nr:putative sensor domain for methyl-accepting chemotaxis sensory transducer [Rickettsiaceae bacterium]